MSRGSGPAGAAVGFRRPWAFWLGVTGVTAGVLLHVPMFLSAKDDHYMLSGMPWDPLMILGMGLIAAGYTLILYGLAPRFSRTARRAPDVEIEALEEGKLSAAYVKLMLVLTVIRYPDGRTTTLRDIAGDRILTVG